MEGNFIVAVNLANDPHNFTLKTKQEKKGKFININRDLHSVIGSSNEPRAVAAVSKSESTSSNQLSETSRTASGWSGAHIIFGFAQSYAMKDWIFLDNQSSATVFSNKELVESIRDTKDTLTLYINGEVLTTGQNL
jgi:hypothetical protein